MLGSGWPAASIARRTPERFGTGVELEELEELAEGETRRAAGRCFTNRALQHYGSPALAGSCPPRGNCRFGHEAMAEYRTSVT